MSKIIEKLLSPVAKEVWILLENPDDWILDYENQPPYAIAHKDTHIGLWVANGVWFLDGYGKAFYRNKEKRWEIEILFEAKAPKIGCFDRHILWRRVTKVLKHLSPNKQTALLNELSEYNRNKDE
jgi:hypothetical protein